CIDDGSDLSKGDLGRCGSGPWEVKSFTAGQEASFVRAQTPYWDADAGQIKTLGYTRFSDANTVLNALNSRQADVAVIPASIREAASRVPDIKFYDFETDSSVTFIFNASNSGVKDARVRQAFAYAINREEIGKQLLDGTCVASPQPWLPSSIAYDQSLTAAGAYDPEKAKQLLKDAGKSEGAAVTVTVIQGQQPAVSVATAVQAQVAKVGITLKLRYDLASNVGSLLAAGTVDGVMFNIPGKPHPFLWLQRNILPNGTLFKAASDEKGAELIKLADDTIRSSASTDELRAQWTKISGLLRKEAWDVPVCRQIMTMAFPSDTVNVQTMGLTSTGFFDPRYLARQ
ncbi:MAG: ABC transporter substrate-binding protein, partial [Thermomicrobiales bacterium]